MILVLVGSDRSYIESISKILEITNGYKIRTEQELNFKNSKEKSILILTHPELKDYRKRHPQSDSADFVIEMMKDRNDDYKPLQYVEFVLTCSDIVECVKLLEQLHNEIQQTYEYYLEVKNKYTV